MPDYDTGDSDWTKDISGRSNVSIDHIRGKYPDRVVGFFNELNEISVPTGHHTTVDGNYIFDFGLGVKREGWVGSDVKINSTGQIQKFTIRPPRFRAVSDPERAEGRLENIMEDIGAPEATFALADEDSRGRIDIHIKHNQSYGTISRKEFMELVKSVRGYWD